MQASFLSAGQYAAGENINNGIDWSGWFEHIIELRRRFQSSLRTFCRSQPSRPAVSPVEHWGSRPLQAPCEPRPPLDGSYKTTSARSMRLNIINQLKPLSPSGELQ
ncbi:hypothetical protein HPP92_004217 [Vanilla planifolia]|uniref:Uncharacterized protein n=1 Tax=Vanilla planifolia TaxID=51239 RepID=A0A835VK51_VANPL|nr:hypothetical protein HPP92_004217 [Vanilla planifolia]